MISFKDYTYRNLQEQVEKNKDDIRWLVKTNKINSFGLKIQLVVEDESEVPTVEEYQALNPDWDFGDTVALDKEGIVTYYVLIRATDNERGTGVWYVLGPIETSAVSSVNGKTGEVELVADDILTEDDDTVQEKIDSKVDKEDGKSLVSDTDIAQITINKLDIATHETTLDDHEERITTLEGKKYYRHTILLGEEIGPEDYDDCFLQSFITTSPEPITNFTDIPLGQYIGYSVRQDPSVLIFTEEEGVKRVYIVSLSVYYQEITDAFIIQTDTVTEV